MSVLGQVNEFQLTEPDNILSGVNENDLLFSLTPYQVESSNNWYNSTSSPLMMFGEEEKSEKKVAMLKILTMNIKIFQKIIPVLFLVEP